MGKRSLAIFFIVIALGVISWCLFIFLDREPEAVSSLSIFRDIEPLPQAMKVTFIPNWYPEAEFAGYFLAENAGYYDALNLNVDIINYSPDYNIADSLAAGVVDFAVVSMAEFIDARKSGLNLVVLGTIFQIEPSVFIVKEGSGIGSPADFEGKRIVCKNAFWRGVIERVISTAGLSLGDVKLVDGANDISEFFKGDIDIWTGYAQDEPIEVEMAGIDARTIYAYDYGVSDYEGIMVVDDALVEKRPDVVVAFLSASLRGWDEAIRRPEDALDAIAVFQPGLSLTFQRKAMREIVPFVHTGEQPIGWINRVRWKGILAENGIEGDSSFNPEFLEAVYFDGL
ncbi:ABC transporter substrate-binding protein [bacterium]|nr:ABC transporter substrate-binding protein [bacterium]